MWGNTGGPRNAVSNDVPHSQQGRHVIVGTPGELSAPFMYPSDDDSGVRPGRCRDTRRVRTRHPDAGDGRVLLSRSWRASVAHLYTRRSNAAGPAPPQSPEA